jgi:hypothetical protein
MDPEIILDIDARIASARFWYLLLSSPSWHYAGIFYCLRLGITLVARNVEVGFGASLDITFQWYDTQKS